MIQLEIDSEVEQRLVEAARARGLEPNVYASKIVSDAVAYTSPKQLSNEEFRTILDRFAERGKNLPRLPDYAYSRESFYEDHD
jgi:hypothetical protein